MIFHENHDIFCWKNCIIKFDPYLLLPKDPNDKHANTFFDLFILPKITSLLKLESCPPVHFGFILSKLTFYAMITFGYKSKHCVANIHFAQILQFNFKCFAVYYSNLNLRMNRLIIHLEHENCHKFDSKYLYVAFSWLICLYRSRDRSSKNQHSCRSSKLK